MIKKLTPYLIFLAPLLLASCALKKSDLMMSGNGVCSTNVYSPKEAFSRSLHPSLMVSCNSCHKQGGSAPGAFADTDPNVAHPEALGEVDFVDVGNSTLVFRVEKVRHNCGSAAECDRLGATFRTQIKAWWDSGQNPRAVPCAAKPNPTNPTNPTNPPNPTSPTEPEPAYTTQAMAIPNNLSKTADTLLTFDLSGASAALAGSHLRIGVRRLLDASSATLGTYQLRDITLATSTKKYRIKNFKLIVNNHATSYLNWNTVDFVVAPQAYTANAATWPFFRMSTKYQEAVYENAGGDMLKVAFDIEETTLAASPNPGNPVSPEQQVFNTQISPLLNANCAGCHGNGRQFNLAGSLDQDRQAAISFSNKTTPTSSTLYRKATNMGGHNGGNALPNANDRDALTRWMATLP